MSFWLALCAALVTAQAQSGPNPATRAEDVEAGGRAFRSHCAECHGRTGEGGRGPALNTGEFHHGSRDEDLFRNISKGIPGTEMPGIYFTDHQIWPLVSFVRSLATAGRRQAPSGRAELGRQIYWGKGGCSGCHAVLGRGGLQGPDLSVIGSQRTPDHLMESLVKPEARVPREWWPLRAVDIEGNAINGRRLNEDAFSVQILDSRGELRSLLKAELRELEVEAKRSTMPSYQSRLTAAEREDLIAYLYSLRRSAE